MIGSTMLTYALYAGMLEEAGLKRMSLARFKEAEMPSIEDPKRVLRIESRLEVMDSMKTSPRFGWAFTHVTSAFGQDIADSSFLLKFRIFSQDGQVNETLGHDSGRMLLRLWDYNYNRLSNNKLKAPYTYADIYFCKEGVSGGGLHWMGFDDNDRDGNNNARPVTTIHIFKIDTIPNNFEKVRELAHEYGHAIYPEVGSFSAPESWANGYAAERIFIKWLYQDLKAGKISARDTIGATEAEFVQYLSTKVDPLVRRIGLAGPDMALLGGKSEASFQEYIALNSYAEAILPQATFARAVKLGASAEGALPFARAIVDAAAERTELPITIPPVLKGQPMWVPISKGTVAGAKVIERKGSWAKIQPTSATVIIKNPLVD